MKGVKGVKGVKGGDTGVGTTRDGGEKWSWLYEDSSFHFYFHTRGRRWPKLGKRGPAGGREPDPAPGTPTVRKPRRG
ncbi:hypothetical protein IMZ48_27380 [Candidatus Bathyarchaeota archaeon]|nr:hypothetical protein [Candidatus Bathyarchaeota archaeon]